MDAPSHLAFSSIAGNIAWQRIGRVCGIDNLQVTIA
jgi:hypothetical protein